MAPHQERRGGTGDTVCLVNEPPLPPPKEHLPRWAAKTGSEPERSALLLLGVAACEQQRKAPPPRSVAEGVRKVRTKSWFSPPASNSSELPDVQHGASSK